MLFRSAAVLAEAAGLLMTPARPSRHQRLIDLDRERWLAYAGALRDGARWAAEASRLRSTPRLLAAGGDISFACERCHLDFRHPEARRPFTQD